MTNPNRVSAIAADDLVQQRTLALRDAIDMTRRAACATAAASAEDQDEFRVAVLLGIQQRLKSLLAQLQALS